MGQKNHQFWSRIEHFWTVPHFEFTDGFEIMHRAWRSIEEVSYFTYLRFTLIWNTSGIYSGTLMHHFSHCIVYFCVIIMILYFLSQHVDHQICVAFYYIRYHTIDIFDRIFFPKGIRYSFINNVSMIYAECDARVVHRVNFLCTMYTILAV